MPFRCCPSKTQRQASIPVAAVGILITAAKRKFQGATSLKLGLRKTRATKSKARRSDTAQSENESAPQAAQVRRQRGLQIKWIQHHRALA